MKLSDIKGDRVFDVIADIIDPIYNIATDEKASAIFRRKDRPEGVDPKAYLAERVKTSLPSLLKTHKADLVAIMAAINGVDPDEYRESLTMSGLLNGLYDIFTDEDLLGFLS